MNEESCRILFVCTGNRCRSPMAAGIMRQRIGQKNLDGYTVYSAGVRAPEGAPPTRQAQRVMAEHGADISRHRAVMLSAEMVRNADIVLVMEQRHKDSAAAMAPECRDRIYLLTAYGREDTETGEEIEDPIGFETDFYRMIYKRLRTEIDRIIPHLPEPENNG